jgi:hypothetical protein
MKQTFKGSLNRITAKIRKNIDDFKQVRQDRRRERNAQHYTTTKHTLVPALITPDRPLRTQAQRELAKHRRQIARASRRANRGLGKGQKQQGRGH